MVTCHVEIVELRTLLGIIEKTDVVAAFSRLLWKCNHSEKVSPWYSGQLLQHNDIDE